MKKMMMLVVLIFSFGLVGCNSTSSLEDVLVSDGGKWQIEGYDGGRGYYVFYDDGKVNILDSSENATNAGNYEYNEENKTLTIDVGTGSRIFTEVELDGDTITLQDGNREIIFHKEE